MGKSIHIQAFKRMGRGESPEAESEENHPGAES